MALPLSLGRCPRSPGDKGGVLLIRLPCLPQMAQLLALRSAPIPLLLRGKDHMEGSLGFRDLSSQCPFLSELFPPHFSTSVAPSSLLLNQLSVHGHWPKAQLLLWELSFEEKEKGIRVSRWWWERPPSPASSLKRLETASQWGCVLGRLGAPGASAKWESARL